MNKTIQNILKRLSFKFSCCAKSTCTLKEEEADDIDRVGAYY